MRWVLYLPLVSISLAVGMAIVVIVVIVKPCIIDWLGVMKLNREQACPSSANVTTPNGR